MIGENGLQNPVWFIGYVEDNSDPLNGRVRVRALGFHPPVTDNTVLTEDLPWAHVARDSKFSSIPDCGDMVVGFFMDGRDAQHPIVIGVVNSAKYSAPASNPGYNPMSPSYVPGINGAGAGSSENAKYAYQYLINKGYTPAQAAGIVGNLQAESGQNLNPAAFNPAGGNLGAQGIAQWRGSRATDFQNRYGHLPKDGTLDEQLDFLVFELQTSHKGADSGIRAADTAAEAATAFDSMFEISSGQYGVPGSTIQTRVNNASTLLEQFAGIEPQPPIEGQNPYVAPSQDVVQNYGNPALPPAFHGENIEYTSALVQSATRRTGGNYDEPGVPTPGGTATSVWHTRYGGSSIELSGKNSTDESIHINHSSGSRITLDGNGNITIKSIGGKVHISSENEIEEVADGKKVAEYGSYELSVIGGVCTVTSAGDMKLSTGANLTLEAGGNITMNAGEAIDIAGATIHATARVDAVDIVAANKLALQSQGGTASITSKGAAYIESSGAVNIKGGGAVKVGGTEIHLNSPDSAPDSAIAAVAAAVPDAIPKTVVSDAPQPTSSSGITADMADDTGVDFSNAM